MADEKKYSAREAAIAVLAKAEEMLKSSKHKHIGWDKLHSKLEDEGYSKESSDKIAGSIKAKVQKAEEDKSHNEIGTEFEKADVLSNKRGVVSPAGHIASANRAFKHAKNPNASSPKIEREMGKESMAAAKAGHQKKLSDLKAQPKPNLTKGEPPPGEIHPKEHVEGEAIAPEKRVEHQEAPGNNPHEQKEGNNPDWGTDPGVKGHIKLAHFMGHRSAKKKGQSSKGAVPGMAEEKAAPPGITKSEESEKNADPKMKKGIALS